MRYQLHGWEFILEMNRSKKIKSPESENRFQGFLLS